ncbi:alcohol dehydrogenase-like protein [Krasilnikovia cinnamomea]|uniref:Alcohol dehydrogenase-like protein n=1 Tax=Krasilnikovia cinnamomea TaxID=349313 RepID=A0A4Q7ZP95_9ACTN|nr:alcohol dehydrogenase-like protein [Krasilnikovia cinnamomea]
MRATTWAGCNKVEVRDVPEPSILNRRDAIVKITSTAICGSDLHLVDGYVPTLRDGDVLGHEFMGEVVEVGPGRLRVGDRVVVPFPIACGACAACANELYSCCENSNPNAGIAEKMFGHPVAGIFGYSHLTGGFAGGQAQYARVPFADVGPIKIESDLADEQVLFLPDILPTGYMGAEMCDIQPSDVVAVWGCGPVGQFTMDSARVLGAAHVTAARAAPGHPVVPQRRHRLRRRCLRRIPRQVPGRGVDEPGAHVAHRPVSCAPVSAAVAGAHRARGVGPDPDHHAHPCVRRGGARVRDLQEEAGRLRKGRAHALARTMIIRYVAAE